MSKRKAETGADLERAAAPLETLLGAVLDSARRAHESLPDAARVRVRLNTVNVRLAFAVVGAPRGEACELQVAADAASLSRLPSGAINTLELSFDISEPTAAERRAAAQEGGR